MIDTPGVRSFGLSHVTRESIVAAFPDLAALTAGTARAAAPTRPGRRSAAWTPPSTRGALAPARLESFRRMIDAGQ